MHGVILSPEPDVLGARDDVDIILPTCTPPALAVDAAQNVIEGNRTDVTSLPTFTQPAMSALCCASQSWFFTPLLVDAAQHTSMKDSETNDTSLPTWSPPANTRAQLQLVITAIQSLTVGAARIVDEGIKADILHNAPHNGVTEDTL